MDPLITAWTDRHTRVALLLAVVALAVLSGLREEWEVAAVVGGAVVVASTLALVLDQFGGLVVGIVAAALLTGGRQLLGLWTTQDFGFALAQVLAVGLTGYLAGRVGMALRVTAADDVAVGSDVEPVFGSLGLLDADHAMLRLQEEIERARTNDRELTLVLLRVEVRDTSLDVAAVTGAHRAVARLVESRVRDADVPFALTHDKLGVILPETDGAAALEPVARFLDGVTTGRFAVRGEDEDEDRMLADTVEVAVGTAVLDDLTGTADALLDTANEALGRAPRSTAPPVPWLS